MRHERVTVEIQERAALHALGMLEPAEAADFERHLASCPLCAAEVRAFLDAASELPWDVTAAVPDPSLRQRLLRRAGPAANSQDLVVRSGEGSWQATAFAGVSVRPLRADPERDEITMLVRMVPGATYPAHHHAGPEQCYVLEGEVRIGELLLHAGDYSCAPPDTVHSLTTSPGGCLLLIIASRQDAVLA
jgi:anti-sigma factor ChrR (cupin superfamily)